MGIEREQPKREESAPVFQVKTPEVGVFEAPSGHVVFDPPRREQRTGDMRTTARMEENSPSSQEQILLERIAELEGQVQAYEEARQARLDRERQANTEKNRRYRDRHREQYRQYKREYMRDWRARRRGQQRPNAK